MDVKCGRGKSGESCREAEGSARSGEAAGLEIAILCIEFLDLGNANLELTLGRAAGYATASMESHCLPRQTPQENKTRQFEEIHVERTA